MPSCRSVAASGVERTVLFPVKILGTKNVEDAGTVPEFGADRPGSTKRSFAGTRGRRPQRRICSSCWLRELSPQVV